ncbi:MAG TPA: valine--tRNA ligase [Candidatus Latescibacteria bacterium]|nr:valine--tRNA ligase [Candidatus Latescibacterota bacterium]
MEKVYNPQITEGKWYRYWEEHGLFNADPNTGRKPYAIVIPPPNVTGILTIGHVLNNTLQDILVRWKRMQGYEALWMPGTDHAGIATQNVVEEGLRREGETRHALGRQRFVERIWQWKERYGGIIIEQLKMLGCSCDWRRERFTMDEGLSRAVREVFVRLYEKGLIYRGKYIINWCPRCQTALSDEETVHQEEQGALWYIRYPIKDDKGYVTVATTRPETMLGDTAVAVNPGDKRYSRLLRKVLLLPILGREIPVIADDLVDPEFGTGAVKVTPAHDPNDFEIGHRHHLPQVIVMNEDGRMNQNAGPKYEGLDRYDCRKRLVKDLEDQGLLERVESHTHSVGRCQRCKTVLEPYLSDQWFVKMRPLAQPAIQAVREGRLKFYPDHWTKTYLHWLENIRDWCISRQLWWGHRIPIWYCDSGHQTVQREEPERCSRCGSTHLVQDEDVLDTWFSSWLWPFSTMGWPEDTPEFRVFYPTDALITGPDIIFLWVARMVMAGYEFTGKCPFSEVYFTSMVRDIQGRKMSKSLGNSPDPTSVIEQYGADALRYTIVEISPQGQDVYYSNEKVEIGRNFCNKIWNAARFVITNLSKEGDTELRGFVCPPSSLTSMPGFELSDRWILSRLCRTISSVTDSLERYRFNEASSCLYNFFWHEYCDWYLELVKPRLYRSGDQSKKKTAQCVMATVLEAMMRLLHPIMPFITEEIWQRLKGLKIQESGVDDDKSIMVTTWPAADPSLIDEDAEIAMALLQEITVAIRNIRAQMRIPPSKPVNAILSPSSEGLLTTIKENHSYIETLGKVRNLSVDLDVRRPSHCATAVIRGVEVFVPLEGLIDLDRERDRLEREIDRVSAQLQRVSAKLKDEDFLKKAPALVVEEQRRKAESYREDLRKLMKGLEALK